MNRVKWSCARICECRKEGRKDTYVAAAELGTFMRISSRGRDPVNMLQWHDDNKRGRDGTLELKIGLTTNEQGRERGVGGGD